MNVPDEGYSRNVSCPLNLVPKYWKKSRFLFRFCVLSYYVSLRSEFRVVMSVTNSAKQNGSVHLYRQLSVGGLMSYLRYLCLFCFSSSCVPCVASFSGFTILIAPYVFGSVYLAYMKRFWNNIRKA